MITHVVLLQPKKDIAQEDIATALKHVEQLQQAIPGIVSVQGGKNMSNFNKGYSHGFVMQFTDREHLQAYGPHPAHKVVSDELVQISENIIDFDVE